MSTLISSAVSGKKAAPKGAPRRRPAPPLGAAKQSTPISVSSTHTSVAPPSPPPTQIAQPEEPPAQPSATPPPPIAPVPSRSQPARTEAPPQPTPIRTPTPTATPAARSSEEVTAEDDDLRAPTAFLAQASKKRKADQAPAKAPAKRAKRNSARSNSLVQAQVNNEEVPVAIDPALRTAEPTVSASPAPPAQPAKKPRKGGRRKKAPVDGDDGSPQHDLELLDRQLAATQPKPRRRKKKTTRAPAESETETEAQQEKIDSSSDDGSDPELHEHDPFTVSMYEISHDKRHGRVSEREKKMASIDWRDVARKRREENDRIVLANQPVPNPPTSGEQVVETTENASGQADPPAPGTSLGPAPEGTSTLGGVKFRIINDQIVQDDETLTIDRQAAAHAQAADETEPVLEEDVLTQRINNFTWLNDRRRNVEDRVPIWKRKSDPWTEEETEKFYECLGVYGTDFYMISTLFAPKTRRQIKSKFTREEKLDPQRVTDALLGRSGASHHNGASIAAPPKLTLEHYARESGHSISEFLRFENAEHAEEVIRESMREKEEEMREAIREEEAQEEAAREALAVRERGRKRAAEKREAREARGVGGAGRGRGAGKRGGRRKGVGGLGGGGPVEEGAVVGAGG